jgi:hypothetical protein
MAMILVALASVACEHEATRYDSCDRTWLDHPYCESGLICDEESDTCQPAGAE